MFFFSRKRGWCGIFWCLKRLLSRGANIPVSKRPRQAEYIIWMVRWSQTRQTAGDFRCLIRDLQFWIHRHRKPSVPLRCFNDMSMACLPSGNGWWAIIHVKCWVPWPQSLCMTATKMEELDKLIPPDSPPKRESSRTDQIFHVSWEVVTCVGSCKGVLSWRETNL